MTTEVLAELERLAVSLETEVELCQTRAQHIRATANAATLRNLLAQIAQAQTPAAVA